MKHGAEVGMRIIDVSGSVHTASFLDTYVVFSHKHSRDFTKPFFTRMSFKPRHSSFHLSRMYYFDPVGGGGSADVVLEVIRLLVH